MSNSYISQRASPSSFGDSCQRVVIHKPGGHDQLTLENHPRPICDAGQVLVGVRASGVCFADTIIRMGLYASAKEFVEGPTTPGFEIAGIILEVGAGVSSLSVGDEVYAVTLFNGYASEVVVDAENVYTKPGHLSFEEAAGVPANFLTAWYALFELAHPRPGSKVLVHSAAGGVGTCLVQLAKQAGCHVVGVVGASHKVAAAIQNGADHVIDKQTQDLWSEAEKLAPDGFDLVLDANGVSTLAASYDHVRRAGKLVVYGFHSMMPKVGGRPNWIKLAANYLRTPKFSPLKMTNSGKSVLAFNLSYLFDRRDIASEGMSQIASWLDSGQISAPPITTYHLRDVAKAHADIESGQTIGKLILKPEESEVTW